MTPPETLRTPAAPADGQATARPAEDAALGVAPPEDVAAYLADMLLELKELSARSGFDTLAKVLEIAEREANWRRAGAR